MIRLLHDGDRAAYAAAQREAFGAPAELPARAFGAFDGDRLVGKLAAHPMSLSLGGAVLPAHGVGDVTVARTHRGRGLGRSLMAAMLADEREHGVAVSVLYPSVPGVYRSYGYATVATRESVRLDPAALARARADRSIQIHEASLAELASAFAGLTAGLDGVLSPLPPGREGSSDLLFTRDRQPVGALRLGREVGRVECEFALASDRAAWETIMALLGSETGADAIDVWTSPHQSVWHWYPSAIRVTQRAHPMMRLLNVAAALGGRGWPRHSQGSWEFGVDDPLLPANSGGYRLELTAGQAHVTRLDSYDGEVSPMADIAALVAGVRRPGQPQWSPLPDDLVAASALQDWSICHGF